MGSIVHTAPPPSLGMGTAGAAAHARPREEELALRVGAWAFAVVPLALALASLIWGLSPKIWPDGYTAARLHRLVTTAPGVALSLGAIVALGVELYLHFTGPRLGWLCRRNVTYAVLAIAALPVLGAVSAYVAHPGLKRMWTELGLLVSVEPVDVTEAERQIAGLEADRAVIIRTNWSEPASAALGRPVVARYALRLEAPATVASAIRIRQAEIDDLSRHVAVLAEPDLDSPSGIAGFQSALAREGLYDLEADGLLGPWTQAGLAARGPRLGPLRARLEALVAEQATAQAEVNAPSAVAMIERQTSELRARVAAFRAAGPVNAEGERMLWIALVLYGVMNMGARAVWGVGELGRAGGDPVLSAARWIGGWPLWERLGVLLGIVRPRAPGDGAPAAAPVPVAPARPPWVRINRMTGERFVIPHWDGRGAEPPLPDPRLRWNKIWVTVDGAPEWAGYPQFKPETHRSAPRPRASKAGGLAVA